MPKKLKVPSVVLPAKRKRRLEVWRDDDILSFVSMHERMMGKGKVVIPICEQNTWPPVNVALVLTENRTIKDNGLTAQEYAELIVSAVNKALDEKTKKNLRKSA